MWREWRQLKASLLYRLATLTAVALMISVSGCALTQERIQLSYAPEPNIVPASSVQKAPVAITVEDSRAAKDHVGHKKNGYGMEMAEIIAENDVPAMVKGAIETELTDRGFMLGPNGVLIQVVLDKFENDFKVGFFSATAVGEVVMNVAVRKADGGLVYTKLIDGTGTVTGVQIMGGNNTKIALDAGLQDAITKLFADPAFVNSLQGAAPAIAAKA